MHFYIYPAALQCGEHMEYKDCGNVCEPTCADPEGNDCQLIGICEEGCFCKEGFVASNEACVPLEECGCTDADGNYYEVRKKRNYQALL